MTTFKELCAERDITFSSTNLPSYMETFLSNYPENKQAIHLLYKSITAQKFNDTVQTQCTESAFDLTGSPLKIDLNATKETDFIFEQVPLWLQEENSHGPIAYKEARKLLNRFHLEDYSENNPGPIYCICDALNDQKIVILGVFSCPPQMMRMHISVYDNLSEFNPMLTTDFMKRKHLTNVRNDNAQVEYEVKSLYLLHGKRKFPNDKNTTSEFNGSVSLQVSWNKCVYEVPDEKADYKLILQVLNGHLQSPISSQWGDLLFLQECSETVFSKSDLAHFSVGSAGLNLHSLDLRIHQILQLGKVVVTTARGKTVNFNLDTVLKGNILKEIWILLRECSSVSDLQLCLSKLFTRLMHMDEKIQVPSSEIILAHILNGINEGNIVIPNFSASETFDIFIELGLEVMKMFYVAVINNNCEILGATFETTWKSLSLTPNPNIDLKKPRKTRLTIPTDTKYKLNNYDTKLSLLFKLHTVVEFLLMTKRHCDFHPSLLSSVIKVALNTYLYNEDEESNIAQLKLNPLHELVVPLSSGSPDFTQRKRPSNWQMKMRSIYKGVEVTTVFNHSTEPVFPNSVYNCSFDGDYFVTELVRYFDL